MRDDNPLIAEAAQSHSLNLKLMTRAGAEMANFLRFIPALNPLPRVFIARRDNTTDARTQRDQQLSFNSSL